MKWLNQWFSYVHYLILLWGISWKYYIITILQYLSQFILQGVNIFSRSVIDVVLHRFTRNQHAARGHQQQNLDKHFHPRLETCTFVGRGEGLLKVAQLTSGCIYTIRLFGNYNRLSGSNGHYELFGFFNRRMHARYCFRNILLIFCLGKREIRCRGWFFSLSQRFIGGGFSNAQEFDFLFFCFIF